MSAGLDLVGAIPVIGEIADTAKTIDKAVDVAKAVDKVNDAGKVGKRIKYPGNNPGKAKIRINKKDGFVVFDYNQNYYELTSFLILCILLDFAWLKTMVFFKCS